MLAFVFGLFWSILIALPHVDGASLAGASPLVPLVSWLAWAGLAFLTVRRLSAAQGWRDVHRLALVFGAELAAMLGGMMALIAAEPIDRIGKLVLDLIAVILFVVLLAKTVRGSGSPQHL